MMAFGLTTTEFNEINIWRFFFIEIHLNPTQLCESSVLSTLNDIFFLRMLFHSAKD